MLCLTRPVYRRGLGSHFIVTFGKQPLHRSNFGPGMKMTRPICQVASKQSLTEEDGRLASDLQFGVAASLVIIGHSCGPGWTVNLN